LREANESKYWLRIMAALEISNDDKLLYLQNEIEAITRILGVIVSKAHKNIKADNV